MVEPASGHRRTVASRANVAKKVGQLVTQGTFFAVRLSAMSKVASLSTGSARPVRALVLRTSSAKASQAVVQAVAKLANLLLRTLEQLQKARCGHSVSWPH